MKKYPDKVTIRVTKADIKPKEKTVRTGRVGSTGICSHVRLMNTEEVHPDEASEYTEGMGVYCARCRKTHWVTILVN